MKRKIKVLALFSILLILVIICKNVLTFNNINYKLNIDGNKIKIEEQVNKNNYYIEIKTDKNVYPFSIYDDVDNKRKVVKDIYFYKDKNIECILPVINNKISVELGRYSPYVEIISTPIPFLLPSLKYPS